MNHFFVCFSLCLTLVYSSFTCQHIISCEWSVRYETKEMVKEERERAKHARRKVFKLMTTFFFFLSFHGWDGTNFFLYLLSKKKEKNINVYDIIFFCVTWKHLFYCHFYVCFSPLFLKKNIVLGDRETKFFSVKTVLYLTEMEKN